MAQVGVEEFLELGGGAFVGEEDVADAFGVPGDVVAEDVEGCAGGEEGIGGMLNCEF